MASSDSSPLSMDLDVAGQTSSPSHLTSNGNFHHRQGQLVCAICGKPATGNHFGATACRACAAFFRRTTVLNLTFVCADEGECVRRKRDFAIVDCKGCRQQQCIAAGMNPNAVQRNRDNLGPRSRKKPTPSCHRSTTDDVDSCSSPTTSSSSQPSVDGISNAFAVLSILEAKPALRDFYLLSRVPLTSRTPFITQIQCAYKLCKSLQTAARLAGGETNFDAEPRLATYPQNLFLRPDDYAFVLESCRKLYYPIQLLSEKAQLGLIKDFFAFHVCFDNAMSTAQYFPDLNDDRMIYTRGYYIQFNSFRQFFQIPEEMAVPELVKSAFESFLKKARLLAMNRWIKLAPCEEELAGLLGGCFWNDYSKHLTTEFEQQLAMQAREAIFEELYLICQTKTTSAEELGKRFTGIVEFIPIVSSLMEELSRNEAVAEIFGITQIDDFEKDMLPTTF